MANANSNASAGTPSRSPIVEEDFTADIRAAPYTDNDEAARKEADVLARKQVRKAETKVQEAKNQTHDHEQFLEVTADRVR